MLRLGGLEVIPAVAVRFLNMVVEPAALGAAGHLLKRRIRGLGIPLERSLSSHFDYPLEADFKVIRMQIDLESPADAGG